MNLNFPGAAFDLWLTTEPDYDFDGPVSDETDDYESDDEVEAYDASRAFGAVDGDL